MPKRDCPSVPARLGAHQKPWPMAALACKSASPHLRTYSPACPGQHASAHLPKHRKTTGEQPPKNSLAQQPKSSVGGLNESATMNLFGCSIPQFPKSTFAPNPYLRFCMIITFASSKG